MRAIVFLAGFSMMVVELLAGRVTAPFLGSSLYTWTGIIGAVLLGIAIGAYVGGRMSDARPPRPLLGWALILGGASVAVAYGLAFLVGPALVGMPWGVPAAMPVFALLVFFPPALVLASVQPLAIKTSLHGLSQAGHVIGNLGAWNAAGSILGTYLTGFVFAYYLSTRLVWFSVAALLILCGLWLISSSSRASA